MPVQLDSLVSIPIAAELLGISPNTLRCWLSQRRLPYHKLGRRTLLRRSDLEQFIEKGRRPAYAKAEDL